MHRGQQSGRPAMLGGRSQVRFTSTIALASKPRAGSGKGVGSETECAAYMCVIERPRDVRGLIGVARDERA